jgi:pyruvate, water dikinase
MIPQFLSSNRDESRCATRRLVATMRLAGRVAGGFCALSLVLSGAGAEAAEGFRIEAIRRLPSRELAIEYQAGPMDYYVLKLLDPIMGVGVPVAVRLGPPTARLDEFRVIPAWTGQEFYLVGRVPRHEPLDLDGDGVDDLFELLRPRYFNPLDPTDVPPWRTGTLAVPHREAFDLLARRSDLPGMLGVRELKFLVAGVDTPYPVIYFMNTENHEFHDEFALSGLGWNLTLQEYNAQTYFTDLNRKNIAGSIVAYDQHRAADGTEGFYGLEFWPADPIAFEHVRLAHDLVLAWMPFVAGQLAYHPSGESQRARLLRERDSFLAAGIRVVTTDELLGGLVYYPLVLGDTFGRLRLVEGTELVTRRDIVVLRTLPNDLSLTAGILTETPQTPLSHVNLKARQNNTPNAHVRGASTHPGIVPWLGQYVHLTIREDDFELRGATQAEVDAFLESIRHPLPQSPPRNLTVTGIQPLRDVRATDAAAFGGKAAYLAELARILPAGMVPDGYAVPFWFYHDFMEQSGLYETAAVMMADPAFQTDPARRDVELDQFRRRIRKEGVLPVWMMDELAALHASFPAGTTPRCRSSSNSEDLVGFNGAGLYDSYTHHLHEGHLAKSIRQVWASLWNYRAFEEREFYRINHLEAAMGVLVHPNFSDERANGVGVTRNIYNPDWRGFYVNVQVGEDLVTNPQPNSIPEELVVSNVGQAGAYEVQYLRYSNLVPAGDTVLTTDQVFELVEAMELIHQHFQHNVFGAGHDPAFAMEIEFKIDVQGQLSIKQARPWVR